VRRVLGAVLDPHATVVEVRDAATGELQASARVPHAAFGSDDDPGAWWRSFAAAVAHAGARDVAAIAVSGRHSGLVLVDEAGVALRAARSWDGARAEVPRIRQALGPERWARRAGLVPDERTPVTRLAWLRRADRRSFERIGTVLLPHEWLTYRLAGRPVTDRGSASGTGLWSPHTGRWIPDVLELLAPEGERDRWVRHLPEVLAPGERADWLDAPVFDQLRLRGRPLVAPGTAAPMAAALALGLARGSVGVALAHATTVVAPLDAPIVDPRGAVTSRADATGRHLAVAEAAGGATLAEAVAGLLGVAVEDLAAVAAEPAGAGDGAPGGDPLVVVPGVEGRAGAVLTGVATGASRGALVRATFAGIACAAVDAVDAVVRAGARWYEHEPLHLAGPASALDLHARSLASVVGRPVVVTPGDAAAAGACVQAAAVHAGLPPEEVALVWGLGRGSRVEPDDDVDRNGLRARHAEEVARLLRAPEG
jgi:xylulokinase